MAALKEKADRCAPVCLMAVFLFAPVLALPDSGVWHGMRVLVMQAAAIGLLLLLVARVRWSFQVWRRFFTMGPNLALLLLVGWAALSLVLMPPAPGRGRDIAVAELLRLAFGAVIYCAAVYFCRSDDYLKRLPLLVLGGGILAGLAGLISFVSAEPHIATAAFGDAQLLAAFLVVLLPIAVAFAQSGEPQCHQRLASVAAVLVGVSLLLTFKRGPWLSGLAGLLVVAVLLLKTTNSRELARNQRCWSLPVIATLGAIGLFFAISGTGREIGATTLAQVRTLAAVPQDGSFHWRWQMWSLGGTLIRDRPLTGWGVGSFPIVASARSREPGSCCSGAAIPPQAHVEKYGSSLSSIAHNEYLQLAAELGLMGLALYLLVLGGVCSQGLTALRRVTGGTRKWLLIGTLGAITAQCVDALGNPGWRFADVSPLFWLVLGMGMAAARPPRESWEAEEASALRTACSFSDRLVRLGWQAMAAVVAVTLVASSSNGQAKPEYCKCELKLRESPIQQRRILPAVCTTIRDPHKIIHVFVHQDVEYTVHPLTAKCTGKCPDAKKSCKAQFSYQWELKGVNPAGGASIINGATDEIVTIRFTQSPVTFTLEVTVKLQCRCGDKDSGDPCEEKGTSTRTFTGHC